MGLGITEIILIFLVVLLFFGAKRLPEVARSMGKAMSEFKKAKDEVFSFPTQTDNEVSKTTGQQVIVKEDRLTTAPGQMSRNPKQSTIPSGDSPKLPFHIKGKNVGGYFPISIACR